MRSASAVPALLACFALAVACSDDAAPPAGEAGAAGAAGSAGSAGKPSDPPTGLSPAIAGTQVLFALGAHETPDTFYDLPYPNNLRLDASGRPKLAGFPNPDSRKGVTDILAIAGDRQAFSVIPIVYFKFSGALPALSDQDVIAADASSPILLLDVDPASSERGRLIPTVARVLAADKYTPENVLAVAARPGFVLRPSRTYAVIVRRALGDAAGMPLGVSAPLVQLAQGQTPEGALGASARTLYASTWETLATKLGIAADTVAAATVFTTADVVKELALLSDAIVARHDVTIDGLAVDPDGGASHARYCQLSGTVSYPQFQAGKPPFQTEGLFVRGEDGLPLEQRKEIAPIVLTLPVGEMPSGGYPLVAYFHGSGGDSHEVVDLGPKKTKDGEYEKGTGVAYVVSAFGHATAGSALPLSPDRLPGASATAYLNINNLPAMRDTFRQGVIEQRLFLEALRKLTIPPEVLAACAGVRLPAGATAFRYREDRLTAQGLSMGGAYTNLLGAVEPRIGAVVPTGAGGFWTYFITVTSLVNGKALGPALFQTSKDFTFQHPVLALLQQGWETIDPLVFMPRLAAHPLPGHPVRPIYEPVAPGDKYFPSVVYDAAALAYENQLVGPEAWPTMTPALALQSDQVSTTYPVKQNRLSEGGVPYTGAVVQFAGDGIGDPHVICTQLDAVKYQFGCFHSSFVKTGVATIPEPGVPGDPCPE